jgi:hypothetical protein
MGGTSFREMTKLEWWNFPRHENYLLIVFADVSFERGPCPGCRVEELGRLLVG